MIRVAILVEGQTESEFVKRILASHLSQRGVFVHDHDLQGRVDVYKIAREMCHYCKSFNVVTSLVDYYGFRGKEGATVVELEKRVRAVVREKMPSGGTCTVYPYVQQHEFEGLLFSNVEAFGQMPMPGGTKATVQKLKRISDRFPTPEDINDSDDSAPSKVIKKVIPRYQKVVNGADLAEWITLAKIRQECKRFNAWVTCLESLGEEVG